MTKVSNHLPKTSYICVQFNPKIHTTMALYRTTFNEMVRILETKDIARIHYGLHYLDIITDDGTEYVYRYKGWSTFKRVFKALFRLSVLIPMPSICTYYFSGAQYTWGEFAPALLKSRNLLDYMINLPDKDFITFPV